MNKFSPKWNPHYVDKLKEHLQSGERFTSFANVIKVNERTIYSWCKEYPEFMQMKLRYENRSRTKMYA